MSKVVALDAPLNRITFVRLGITTTLEFDLRYFLVRRERFGVDIGTAAHLLHRLSPKISRGLSGDSVAVRWVRSGLLCLLAAIVVYFSDYNQHIQLLAPSLALLGLIGFAANWRKAYPHYWLIVNDEFGRDVAKIPAERDLNAVDSRYVAFVTSLTSAIETAKQKEYGLEVKA